MNLPVVEPWRQYTFDHRIADCSTCPLSGRRDDTICLSQKPHGAFNGLMILGEGPGSNEAKLKTPFIGRSGALLDELLKNVGIKREECYVGNATLCCPPIMGDKEKAAALEKAVPACRSRLLAEIEHLQPRVILAFGGPALSTLTGRLIAKTKRLPKFRDASGNALACPQCAGEMTLAWWKCPACKHENILPPRWDPWMGQTVQGPWYCAQGSSIGKPCGPAPQIDIDENGEPVGYDAPAGFPSVEIQKRKKRCPTCLGKKTEEVEVHEWKTEHKISAVAGALFRGRYAADFEAMDAEARVDLPCHYVIPTWHPAFLLRQPEGNQKKTMAGQFLVNASLEHLGKAARLLKEDARWTYRHQVVPDDLIRDVLHLPEDDPTRLHAQALALKDSLDTIRAYLYCDPAPLCTAVDIETDAKNPFEVHDIRCIGFCHTWPTDAATQAQHALVVNTSGLMAGHPLVDLIIDWLRDPSRLKVMQNGVFDTQVVECLWGV